MYSLLIKCFLQYLPDIFAIIKFKRSIFSNSNILTYVTRAMPFMHTKSKAYVSWRKRNSGIMLNNYLWRASQKHAACLWWGCVDRVHYWCIISLRIRLPIMHLLYHRIFFVVHLIDRIILCINYLPSCKIKSNFSVSSRSMPCFPELFFTLTQLFSVLLTQPTICVCSIVVALIIYHLSPPHTENIERQWI